MFSVLPIAVLPGCLLWVLDSNAGHWLHSMKEHVMCTSSNGQQPLLLVGQAK